MVEHGLRVGEIQWGRVLIIEPIEGSNRVLIADDRLLDWIAVRLPHVGANHDWHGRGRAIGIGMGGEIIAGMAVLDMDKRFGNAEIAMAATTPRWASRATIRKMLAYPFEQLNCRRITTVTAASNEAALKMNRQLGFQHEGVMRKALGEEDAVIMGLLKEEAERWLRLPVISRNVPELTMAATA